MDELREKIQNYINNHREELILDAKKTAANYDLDDLGYMCNYDGQCQVSTRLNELGFSFCYGRFYGEEFCPMTHIIKKYKLIEECEKNLYQNIGKIANDTEDDSPKELKIYAHKCYGVSETGEGGEK